MDHVSRSNSRADLVSETSLPRIAHIRVQDEQRTVCRLQVFQARPAGRLALFRYLLSWFSHGLKDGHFLGYVKSSGSFRGCSTCISCLRQGEVSCLRFGLLENFGGQSDYTVNLVAIDLWWPRLISLLVPLMLSSYTFLHYLP